MKQNFSLVLFLIAIQAVAQEVELVIPVGHTRQIRDIALSEDTVYLASIQNGPEIILWNYSTQEQFRTLNYHQGRTNKISFSGRYLWSASDDGFVKAWSLDNHKIEKSFEIGEPVLHVAINGEDMLAVGKEGGVSKWSSTTGEKLAEIDLEIPVTEVSAIADNTVAIGSGQGQLVLLNVENVGVVQQSDIGADIGALALSEEQIFVGSLTGELITLEKEDFREINRIQVLQDRLYDIERVEGALLASGRGNPQHLAKVSLEDFSVEFLNLKLGNPSALAKNGIVSIHWDDQVKRAFIPDYNFGIGEFDISKEVAYKTYRGLAHQIEDLAVSNNEKFLAVATTEDQIEVFDLTGPSFVLVLQGHAGGVRSLAFHPTDSLLASVGNDNKLRIWSLRDGRLKQTFNLRGEYLTSLIQFDESGRYIIRKGDNKFFELFRLDRSRTKKLNVENGIDYQFVKNGESILFRTRSGFKLFNSISLKEEGSYDIGRVKDFDVSGNTIVTATNEGIDFYDLDFRKKGNISYAGGIDRIYVSPAENIAIGTVNSARKGSSLRDYRIKVFDLESSALLEELDIHDGFTSEVLFLKNGRFMLTGASDGRIQITKISSENRLLGALLPLTSGEWVVVTPNGLYDASASAFRAMHYVRGSQKIALDQLKDFYFEPQLLPRILENIDDPLPTPKSLNDLSPHPEINIDHPNLNNGTLGVNLEDKGGGIGRLIILINGKEVVRETGSSKNIEGGVDFQYGIEGHPFLKPNAVNKITIKAYNEEGTLSTPEENLFYFNSRSGDDGSNPPKLYALIAGSGDYPGQNLDLNYAVKDAIDFSSALANSSNNFFGASNTEIKLLHTDFEDTAQWPTKSNILQVLQAFSQKAKAQDHLLLYFSGHGMNYGPIVEDFYYLTPFATDHIENDKMREEAMLSSTELTQSINTIPALKQVLVIDACHSGKLAAQLGGNSNLDSDQLKALENMKDRTGLYIIAGSESDAVSYETSLFQQGLLTYSLLFGMKGAALGANGEVDIVELMQFASRKVPELATEIGGIQLPEVRIPTGAETFTIGKLDNEDRDKIQLAGSKPIFIHSGFQEQDQFFDLIQLGAMVDERLISESRKEEPPLIFLDKKQFGSAYQIRGRYRLEGELWQADVKVFREEEKITDFNVSAINGEVLSEKIITRSLAEVLKP